MDTVEWKVNHRLVARLRRNTLHKLGYGAQKVVDPAVKVTLDEALNVARKVVRPKGIYRILPVLDVSGRGITTEAGTIRSSLFARLAAMCEGDQSIVFMIATLGEEFEETCGPEEPVHRQMVFDTVGAELAEIVADLLELDWRQKLDGSRLQSSLRFSPGYCDWPLEGQSVIAASLDTGAVGVQLTSNFIMMPRKSVSAIAVVARGVPIPAPCVFCVYDDCPSRRLPKQKRCLTENDIEAR